MSDLVSIIMPTYNRAYILPTSVKSVLNQTYPNWELLVIDDGSTDNTKGIVESFGDSRIRYTYQENQRQAAARNRGLEVAEGKWITFLDSDDEFFPPFLERALQALEADSSKLCLIPKGKKTHELWENGMLVESKEVDAFPDQTDNVIKDIFMRKFVFSMDGFMHASSIRDEGIRFDPTFRGMEDWDYAMTIGEQHPDAFVYIHEPLYVYHQRFGKDGLVSNTTYAQFADTFEQMYQKHKDDTLMMEQEWYPNRVEKWRKIQAEYEKGLMPPPQRYFFST
jgi:glycosyltransferase involved in cell wall biosynthesis